MSLDELRRLLQDAEAEASKITDHSTDSDRTAGRYALITVTTPTAAQQHEIARRGAVLIVAAPDTELHGWLRQGRARAAVVRPDGTVQRTGRHITALIDGLTTLTPSVRPVPAQPPPAHATPVPTSPTSAPDQP